MKHIEKFITDLEDSLERAKEHDWTVSVLTAGPEPEELLEELKNLLALKKEINYAGLIVVNEVAEIEPALADAMKSVLD